MFNKVVEQSKHVGDKQTIGVYTGMIGQSYSVQGDYEQAIANFEKSIIILDEVGTDFTLHP